MNMNLKPTISLVLILALLPIISGAACSEEIPPGVYEAAKEGLEHSLRIFDSWGHCFGIEEREKLEKADLGVAIEVRHRVELSHIVVSSPEKLLQRGVLLRYVVPILIDGKSWRSVRIHQRPKNVGNWKYIGSHDTRLCIESMTVADSVSTVEMVHILFYDNIHVALVKLNATYYFSPINGKGVSVFCGRHCDPDSINMIEYSEAVEFYKNKGQ